jgi:hypothetical protein
MGNGEGRAIGGGEVSNGAVGFEQGTSKVEDSLPCTKSHIPSKGFLLI